MYALAVRAASVHTVWQYAILAHTYIERVFFDEHRGTQLSTHINSKIMWMNNYCTFCCYLARRIL